MPTSHAYGAYHNPHEDVPETRVLHSTRRVARTEHCLGCGHTVRPGEKYYDAALIVDGEFVWHTGGCPQCDRELLGGEA